jgi:hypothetical protein
MSTSSSLVDLLLLRGRRLLLLLLRSRRLRLLLLRSYCHQHRVGRGRALLGLLLLLLVMGGMMSGMGTRRHGS